MIIEPPREKPLPLPRRLFAPEGGAFMGDKPEEYAKFKERTGMTAVPLIFINDELIGGYTDLTELDRPPAQPRRTN